MDLVTSPWESRKRVDYIRDLVGKGDLTVLSHALLFPTDQWDEGFGVTSVLCGLPEADRMALARSFVEYARAGGGDQKRGLVLLAAVSRGFTVGPWCDAWEALLREKARRLRYCGTQDELWTCSHALLDAGSPPSPTSA
ncbi:hypothetical protein ACQEVG_36375 [Streptomyces sp. CA-135486]|uniref:hypothetical protein n=1 Tax=Streptomyces sp. CA-135486 TaxID=3240049 RepID=UPI003D914E03